MSRADSPLRNRMIFCFGARRSGTYLLQRIITAHPLVSGVPSETHLFSHGVRPLLERFHHGDPSSSEVGSLYADRELLLDAVRDFCDRVLGGYIEAGSERLAERTPLHATVSELIAQIYPDAWFAHIVRDGRDVARSMLKHEWGAESIADAAAEWRDTVTAGRRIARHPRYLEVRYEDVVRNPDGQTRDLYRGLDLEVSPTVLEAAGAALAERRNLNPEGEDVGVGKWRGDWSREDLSQFERVAGELSRQLGYEGGPLRQRLRRVSRRRSRLG